MDSAFFYMGTGPAYSPIGPCEEFVNREQLVLLQKEVSSPRPGLGL